MKPQKKQKTAKLFQNGGSQAVRLPKEFRFPDQDEVLVRREGRRIILEPVDRWSEKFLKSLGSAAGEEELERIDQGTLDDLKDPFAE